MKRSAHVRNDGKPSYKKEIRLQGQRVTRRFSRISDAERWYSEKKREKELAEAGILPREAQQTQLSDFVDIWQEKRRSQGKPLGSWLSDHERLQKWVLPVFGSRTLQMISSQEFESFLDRLVSKERLSPTTRNRVRSLLHKIYNDARRQGLIQENPVSRTEVWKEPKTAFDYLQTLEECQSYLEHAASLSPTFYAFASLAINTGARIGEIQALQNRDVDLPNRRLHIWKTKELRNGEIYKRTKGGGDRWIGINDEVFEVLTLHRRKSKFGKPDDFVLCREDGGSTDSCTLRRQHIQVCRLAGLREIRVHDLRHTFASHFVMNGGSLNDLQALLGHSSPVMTQRYAHLAPGYLESKAQLVRFGKFGANVCALKAVR